MRDVLLGRPALGTHDAALIGRLIQEADACDVPRREYEFQLLYGIRSAEQARLVADGHAARVLVSQGDAWFPWFMRRLAERPANVVFVAKTLVS